MDKNRNVKLIDFGLSRSKGKELSRVGTPNYTAPEVLQGQDYSESADIFSLGILLNEMCSRTYPFWDEENLHLVVSKIQNGVRPPIPNEIPQQWKDVIKDCYSADPKERPSILHIISKLSDAETEMSQLSFPFIERVRFFDEET